MQQPTGLPHLPEHHPKFYISSMRLGLRPKPISLSSPRLNTHCPVAQDKIVACFLSHSISSSWGNPAWLDLETLSRIQPLPLLRQLLSQAQHQSHLPGALAWPRPVSLLPCSATHSPLSTQQPKGGVGSKNGSLVISPSTSHWKPSMTSHGNAKQNLKSLPGPERPSLTCTPVYTCDLPSCPSRSGRALQIP